MSDDIIGRIMDKAAKADRRALFAALQEALLQITDLQYGMTRRDPHEAIEEALDVGAEHGSPERLAYNQAKIERGER